MGPGLFAHPDRAQRDGRHAVTKRQKQKFTTLEADALEEAVETSQDRISQGKANDRGAHAGGLVEGIGCQEVLLRHQQRDGGLLGRCKELGEHRFQKGHHQQGPVPPAEAEPMGSWQQEKRGEHHQKSSQPVGGDHHPPFGPAVDPDPRDRTQHHRRDRVGDINPRRQKGDPLCTGFEVHADR